MSMTPPPMGYWRRWRASMLLPAVGVLGAIAMAIGVAMLGMIGVPSPPDLGVLVLGVGIGVVVLGVGLAAALTAAVALSALGPHRTRTAMRSAWTMLLTWCLGGATLGMIVVTVAQWGSSTALARVGLVAACVVVGIGTIVCMVLDPADPRPIEQASVRHGQVVAPARRHVWQMSWKSGAIGVVEFRDRQGHTRFAVDLPANGLSANERVEQGHVLYEAARPDRPIRFAPTPRARD